MPPRSFGAPCYRTINKMKKYRIHRLLWAICLLLAAILIGQRGGAPSFLIFWGLLLMPVFSFAFRRVVKAGVVIRLEVEDGSVVRGERLPCTLRLTNETYLPIPLVRIRMTDGKIRFDDEDLDFTCALQPGETREFSFKPLCRHLGLALIGASSIEIPDYFSLTAVRYERTEKIHVLPRRQRMESVQIVPPEEEERRQVDRSYLGDHVPDGQWKLYQQGDDLRRVNWKLTARRQELIMKNLIPEPKNELIVIPDGRDQLPEGRAGWLAEDSIVEGTLAIADYFLRFGIAMRVVPDLKRDVSVTAMSSYQKLYKLMARGFFSGTMWVDEVLVRLEQMVGAARYVLLTWEVDEEMIRTLSGVISRGSTITLIYIGEDGTAKSLASAEKKIAFYQVTSQHDIFQTLKGRKEKGGRLGGAA